MDKKSLQSTSFGIRFFMSASLLILVPPSVEAGIFDDIKEAGEEAVNDATETIGDAVNDEVEDTVSGGGSKDPASPASASDGGNAQGSGGGVQAPATSGGAPTGANQDAGPPANMPATPRATAQWIGLRAWRDNPLPPDNERLLKFARYLIEEEQELWQEIGEELARMKSVEDSRLGAEFNANRLHFGFAWNRAKQSQPTLTDALADVFVKPDPDWSFLDNTAHWDPKADSLLTITLFDRESIEGRAAEFAARDLVSVVRNHLDRVSARSPRAMWLEAPLPPFEYDFDAGALVLNYRSNSNGELLDVYGRNEGLVRMERPGGGTAEGALYFMRIEAAPDLKTRPPGFAQHTRFVTSIGQWRSLLTSSLYRKAQALLLDRRLSLRSLSLPADEAESLIADLNDRSGLSARIRFTVTGTVAGAEGLTTIATLNAVDIVRPDGRLVKRLAPEKFPRAASVEEARRKQEEAAKRARAKREAEAERQARAEQRRTQEVKKRRRAERERLLAECETLKSPVARAECPLELARSGKLPFAPGYDMSKFENRYRGRATAARNAREAHCTEYLRESYQEGSGPRPDTSAYGTAMKNCVQAWLPNPYGPAMIDLRLGLDAHEATVRAARRMDVERYESSALSKPAPFDGAKLFIDDEADRGLALFFIEEKLAGVSRRLYFNDGGPEAGQILQGLRDSYGAAARVAENGTRVWTFAETAGDRCVNLAERIAARGGWDKAWTPAGFAEAKQQARRPLMVRPAASAKRYADLAECGPVLMARMNKDANDRVREAAFVMVDPGWIANRLGYMFTEKPEGETSGIDF